MHEHVKAQAAFEYMVIVIIALGFMIPIWLYVTSVKSNTTQELSLSYAKNTVEKLASTADLIYSQGAPAKVKVNVYIPDGVIGYLLANYTINLVMVYESTVTDVFAVSRARINGTLPTSEGNYWIQIEAVDNPNYDVSMQTV